MRFLSFKRRSQTSYGVATDEGVIDLGLRMRREFPTLRHVLEAGALQRAREEAAALKPDCGLHEIDFLPVIPEPRKTLCVGINYLKVHPTRGEVERPANPTIFAKVPGALVGHLQPLVKPKVSEHFDYEGELAAVIGRPGRHIKKEDALSHVAGYTCLNDGSVRDWQKHSVVAGKNFYASGSCGPWMVTADEVPDPSKLTLSTRLNGEEVQSTTTDKMIFDLPTMIAYLSTITLLEPGDIISTGSPEGSGAKRDPVRFLRPGDLLEIEFSGIGVLRNEVIAE